MLEAEKFTPVDAGLIPTGEIRDVADSPMDFRTPHAIGERIGQVEGGYDHNFVLRSGGG
jgi:aldose 1-epimerase